MDRLALGDNEFPVTRGIESCSPAFLRTFKRTMTFNDL